ncbi:MAG: RNA polymerase sigma factor [Steroidobacteraceae bacterium]
MSYEMTLVRRMLDGDQRAFDEFFDAYSARLAAFAARRSALEPAAVEDVVQMTMINAVRGLPSFRGGSTLFTWLCQICRNLLADARRKEQRQPRMGSLDGLLASPGAEMMHLTDHRDPLQECTEDSTRAGVRRAINALSANHARILELRYGDDLTVPEIARLLQISEDAAESRLARARQAFREEWKRSGDADPGASSREQA